MTERQDGLKTVLGARGNYKAMIGLLLSLLEFRISSRQLSAFFTVLKSAVENLNDSLTEILEQHDVPSLAAAVVFGGEIHAAGAVGVRKRGDDTPVTVDDKYHIGSCTKAMTATLAGIFVERGLLSWETALLEVFPEMEIHPGYQTVTLKQLLSHTSGLPAFTNPAEEDEALVDLFDIYTGSAMDARLNVVIPAILSRSPRLPPGEQYLY